MEVNKITNNDGMYAYVEYAAWDYIDDTLWFLDMYGPTTGVRAIAASFHSGHRLEVGWRSLRRPSHTKFIMLRTTLIGGNTRMVLFPDPVATRRFAIVAPLLNGRKPWDVLIQALSSYTIWPVKHEWAPSIWKYAHKIAPAKVPLTALTPIMTRPEPVTKDILVNLDGAWDEVITTAAQQELFTA